MHVARRGPQYLDGIAFDRTTIERVRKGMEAAKSSVRIDIHQSNGGGCKNGGWGSPALKYMQHFAFADSLWFGEGRLSSRVCAIYYAFRDT